MKVIASNEILIDQIGAEDISTRCATDLWPLSNIREEINTQSPQQESNSNYERYKFA